MVLIELSGLNIRNAEIGGFKMNVPSLLEEYTIVKGIKGMCQIIEPS